jgi:hypothetical protein
VSSRGPRTTRRRMRTITPRVLKEIEDRASLMRWSGRLDDEDKPIEGSLADRFWNSDVPRLIAAVKAHLEAE